jgi:outer membrane protein OmpA-like peptidoglycan-associated protein
LTAVEALAAEAGAPESGYLSAATNNILGASRVPNTRRAAGVATLSAEPRPNNGPAIRDPVPEASVPVTATDEGPSDTPAIESESFDPHSKPEPKAEEQVPATTVASREPSEATEAPPPNGRESQGTEVTIVSESESSDGPSPETVEEETTREADADTAELPESGVSITGETEIGTIREELRGLGYQVREHENGDISLNLWEAVPFAFDSAEVPPRAHESLQELADIFLRNTNTKVKIVGHTDDRGPSQYNKRLSLQRAQAVEAYLHGKGLPKERLYSEGRGEDAPSSLGESDEVHSPRQRRTEILVQPLASRY